jgi:hypothetical protein
MDSPSKIRISAKLCLREGLRSSREYECLMWRKQRLFSDMPAPKSSIRFAYHHVRARALGTKGDGKAFFAANSSRLIG